MLKWTNKHNYIIEQQPYCNSSNLEASTMKKEKKEYT